MTQWYNTGQQQEGVNGHWYYPGDGTAIWVTDTSQQGNYQGQGSGRAAPGHWQDNGQGAWVWVADNGMGGSGPGAPPPATGAPKPPDTPDPYPALDMTWRNNDQYSVYGRLHGQGSYFQGANGQPLDTSQQLFYQTGEGQHPAYQRFMGEEADPNSYYSRWLGSQEGRVEGAFKNASVADPNLQRTYFYDAQAKGLNSTFANLPGWQQGYNAPGGFAGRRM